ncbi:hypothetical protein [Pseudomonas putida]|uniref:hypothetical protein n=1 Tax=Pseudomonas putida TaxID=303 RepID=UPI003D9778C0
MSNDIDLYDNTDIQPYNPGVPLLSPLSPTPDTWGNNEILREDQHHQSGPTLFGSPVAAGTTPQQIQGVLAEIGGAYLSDFTKLNYPSHLIQSAITFFMDNATKPARQVQRQHKFDLHNETGDWLAESFGNYLQGLAGTQQQKQQFLDNSLIWLEKLNKRLNSQQVRSEPVPRRASNSTEAILNSLSDADYNKVIKINEQALARTMQVLQQRWGDYTFQQNIEVAQNYFNRLPVNEQQFFDQFTTVNGTPYVHMRNTVEFITAMFDAATGAHNLPTGAGIAQEIAECEKVMRTNRKEWLADSALQARYRTLLDMRGN